METYSSNFYLHKAMALAFALGFIGLSFYGLFFPDSVKVQFGNEIVETNFQHLLPFIIVGLLALLLFIWMVRNYFRVRMDNSGITVLKIRREIKFEWNEIESIKGVDWLWKGSIFKVSSRHGRTFYFLADKPQMNFKEMLRGSFRTEMGEFIDLKKKELAI